MVDLHRHNNVQLEQPRTKTKWGSLVNDSLINILESEARLKPTPLTLAPVNSNIYARRHSAHSCPVTEERPALAIPPPVPSRPPAIPKRSHVPPSNHIEQVKQAKPSPSIPPTSRTRGPPPVPPARNLVDSVQKRTDIVKYVPQQSHLSNKQFPVNCAFEFVTNVSHESNRLPPAAGPPPSAQKPPYKSPISPATKVPPSSQCNSTKISIRQDSGVSSDSFSQTSSPSYTTKTMEIPLLPPRTPVKQNCVLGKVGHVEDDSNNSTITKSASTPASLQTIVKFHNGSNMSLHHKITPSTGDGKSPRYKNTSSVYRANIALLNEIKLVQID